MSKFVNSVVLGLVSFVLILSVFWYVVEIRQESQVQISDVAVGWGTVDARNSELRFLLAVQNPHKSPAELVELSYEILVNGNRVGEGLINETLEIPPEGNATREFSTTIPSRFVVDWLDRHIEDDENSKLLVRGEAMFAITTLRTVAPYEWESSWHGLYIDRLASALRNCPASGTEPCISQTAAAWDTTGTRAGIEARFALQNNNPHALRIKGWTADLLLHNLTVAKGTTDNTILLAANSEQEVETTILFDRLQLPQWWPAHVQECEKSPSTIIIKFLVEEDRVINESTQTVVTAITWEFGGPVFDTGFLCRPA